MEDEPRESPSPPEIEVDEERRGALSFFLARHGIQPNDWKLYHIALTHSSHAFENSLDYNNERLEFLGDSVIGLLVAMHLFKTNRAGREGELSKAKSQLVSRNVLGRLALELGLGEVILLGRGEEQTGGRRRLSLLGSALEALVGAIYLDEGLEASHRFLAPFLLNVHDTITQQDDYQDYKSRLQEIVQSEHGSVPTYDTIDASGPDHAKVFTVQVTVEGRILAVASGSRVKSAENRAAKKALRKISAIE